MKRFLKEPLLHFLLLGAAIFAAYRLLPHPGGSETGKIVVTRGRIQALASGFARAWRRPPTASELEGLIRDYIIDEACVREATALGLDRDDLIIRRRLRQKLEFVSEDLAAQAEPTVDQLRAYLAAHPDPFRPEPRFTFSHIYLNPERRGQRLACDAGRLLAQLRREGGWAEVAALGDPFLLANRFEALPASEARKMFGETFSAALGGLKPGAWQGPVESGYGTHLVRVDERVEGSVPPLAEVREAVRREWANARRLDATQEFYQALLHRYAVTVEEPPMAARERRAGESKP